VTRQPETAPLRPSAAYAAGVAAGRWQDDVGQRAALVELDRLFDELMAAARAPRPWLARLLPGREDRPAPRGLYLWGEVGRGKTFLTELLVEHLPLAAKRRVHFHRFMGEVHAELKRLGQRSDPLPQVAEAIAANTRLLCLDEFFVSDIGDAMILARLLESLFARGVTLLATSNTEPARLYRDGLQRARFLPAIALIERHCAVHRIDSPQDYRLRTLTQAPVYRHPLGAEADDFLRERFDALTAESLPESGPLIVNGRGIPLREAAEGVAWFDFAALCEGPRAVADYIEIARDFHTVLLADVPRFGPEGDNAARRFVHLVDEFYDRGVNLILTAAAPPTALYAGERLAAEFERTASRLIEMQSQDYLGREHRA
jgi:cell division protein ZapE